MHLFLGFLQIEFARELPLRADGGPLHGGVQLRSVEHASWYGKRTRYTDFYFRFGALAVDSIERPRDSAGRFWSTFTMGGGFGCVL